MDKATNRAAGSLATLEALLRTVEIEINRVRSEGSTLPDNVDTLLRTAATDTVALSRLISDARGWIITL